ncbi:MULTISPECIES: membrane lipoprotein lipid attachment site-containing protein [Jeotgalicoccus]|uniref:membrane lipoprotein lipid attachment site-containing protein n=1 Tax=Jeotgalicoccus TaxID=227979 RepID=UPI0003FECB4A|nr:MULTISPECIES: membrane lipoprotein lipid attachment site-containing protein [Jeotgalicoccus]QQD85210.1 membrane lipoprotein lipid attachment site-containing protein [Jeotgalicoccus sp. ATCC 8456]
MKRYILLFSFILLVLSACSSESTENYSQMTSAFERNDSELNKKISETVTNIQEESNRDKALADINEGIIPRIDDFKQTIDNYTLSDEAHIEVQEAIQTYLDNLRTLMELYSEINSEFFIVNPFEDASLSEDINQQLEEIQNLEEEVQKNRADIDQLISENNE